MSDRKLALNGLISREFFKAALLPLLGIEIALVALYFSINGYNLRNSGECIERECISHIQEIVDNQARTISKQFQNITSLSLVLQSETKRFFYNPDQFPNQGNSGVFGFSQNGVYCKLNKIGCSLFYSNRHTVGPEEKEKAARSEALDPIYENIYKANRNIMAVYLNTFDSMNRYYPYIDRVYEQFAPDLNIPEFNFYYLADKENNPERKPIWTDAYLDPAGKGWMMSCVAPVYCGDFLEGVTGIDITIKNCVDNILNLELPWGAFAFLVDSWGTIMAMRPEAEPLLGVQELRGHVYSGKVLQDTYKPEEFNLLKSELPGVAEAVSHLMSQKKGVENLRIGSCQYFLTQATVSETGWKLMVLADKEKILQPISFLKRNAEKVGYFAVGIMVIFYLIFFCYLIFNTRRISLRIASPVADLSQASIFLAGGEYQNRLKHCGVKELDDMFDAFGSMAQELENLHKDLEKEVIRADKAKNDAREAGEELARQRDHLEELVEERNLELIEANRQLQLDINRRRRAEEELDLERRQLLSIFDSIDEPVYVSDPETYELLYVNEAFKKHWGDGTGQKCHQVVQHTDSPCSYCTNDLIFGENTGRAYIWEARNGSANRWFRCFDKAIRWPDCRMVRYEMAIDITEQKRAGEAKEKLEARLQRAERMEAIGILAGGVAHDLNNILSGIVSYPDLLLMKLPKDSELREPVLTIQRSGQKAADVVQDLLTLARRGVTITEVVNLNNIITGYLSSPEHERLKAFHPTVEFDADLETDLLNNVGSPVHLSKAVMNLAANAAEALAEGGKVIMSTRNLYIDRPINGYDEVKEGDYVALSVKDNGIGISADDLERIFEPFYSSKVMGRSGTGLGTAVVWGTVKDHNGYIDIESEEGKGTTFTFYLPATREEIATEKSISSFGDYMGKGESVLVVDDIEEQREIASGILTSLGYSVSSVSSGEEAVDYVMNNSVDLLVLDMVMDNGIDGLETYKRIIELHPGQKAVIVSGFSESDRVREAQGLGAGPYVKKPYVLEKIGLAVRSELDNH